MDLCKTKRDEKQVLSGSKDVENCLKAFDMWYCRQISRISRIYVCVKMLFERMRKYKDVLNAMLIREFEIFRTCKTRDDKQKTLVLVI